MKSRIIFLFLLFPVLLVSNLFAQSMNTSVSKLGLESDEWAVLFPQIPHCEQNILIQQIDDTASIYALYVGKAVKSGKMIRYPKNNRCGKIEYVFSISGKSFSRKSTLSEPTPFYRPFKIKEFDTYTIYPRCGVGSPGISMSIFFDNDKIMYVNEKNQFGLLKFPKRANFSKIKIIINKLTISIKNNN